MVATYYYHYDGLGSTERLTNASQTTTDTYTYAPFGGTGNADKQSTTANPYRWLGSIGYRTDSTLAAFPLAVRARSYDFNYGAWISRDPIETDDWNPYRYVRNNPLNRVDPSGTILLLPIVIPIGIACGMAICAWQAKKARDDHCSQQPDATQQACLDQANRYFKSAGLALESCIEVTSVGTCTKGNAPWTVWSMCPGWQTFIPPVDFNCGDCTEFVKFVSTLYHECLHGRFKNDSEKYAYCTEAKFIDTILRNNTPPPCKGDPEWRNIVQAQYQEAMTECKLYGGP